LRSWQRCLASFNATTFYSSNPGSCRPSNTTLNRTMNSGRGAIALIKRSRRIVDSTSCHNPLRNSSRTFTSSRIHHNETPATTLTDGGSANQLDPLLVHTRTDEEALKKQGKMPIGSRRRRAALSLPTAGLSFEELPYQCFQEARKILAEQRAETVQKIKLMQERMARLREQDPAISGGEFRKQHRLNSMQRLFDNLKLEADAHDPRVKMNFEDGTGMY
jgi:large subunit ribosomal protein L35